MTISMILDQLSVIFMSGRASGNLELLPQLHKFDSKSRNLANPSTAAIEVLSSSLWLRPIITKLKFFQGFQLPDPITFSRLDA